MFDGLQVRERDGHLMSLFPKRLVDKLGSGKGKIPNTTISYYNFIFRVSPLQTTNKIIKVIANIQCMLTMCQAPILNTVHLSFTITP